jgi:oligosaccharide repeat unit polymerase
VIILLLIIEALILGYFDYKVYGSIYTPVTVLAVPFILVVFFNLLWGKSAGMVPLYLPSLWVWVVGLFVFWLPGLLMSIIIVRKTDIIHDPFKELNINDLKLITFLRILSLILIVVMYFKLISSLTKFKFGSEELSASLSGGIAAHASIWLIIPVTYLLMISKFKKKCLFNWMIILFWLIYAFLYNSKTWILIPIIAGIIGRLLILKIKITFKRVVVLLGLGVALFFISYSLSFGYWAPWNFIKNHFIYYTNAGLIGFSEYTRLKRDIGISMEFLFQPIFNIYYKISGHKLMSIISDLPVAVDNVHFSNVKTFFGDIFVYGGMMGGIITSFIWGGICYLFLILNIIFRHVILFMIFLIFLAGLFFGWFGIYFNNLGYYEVLMVGLLLVIITTIVFEKGKIKIKRY